MEVEDSTASSLLFFSLISDSLSMACMVDRKKVQVSIL
jgi:hypothetical protein